uniref:Kazal-like domain-containing protein n=1 Tax=Salmo trutta TaxID=8032 RepID=A0A674A597_SALTR
LVQGQIFTLSAQAFDPATFQGRCRGRGEPELKCMSEAHGSACGSDGRTYPNLCQLREAASRKGTTLRLTGQGPCYSGDYNQILL